MLTVDKSLEKLRADHAAKGAKTARTSTTSQSAANQCVKATQVLFIDFVADRIEVDVWNWSHLSLGLLHVIQSIRGKSFN